MECRAGCGACCIALSISSSIPGMPPGGKPAGVRCVQLDDDHRCRLFGRPERPAVCSAFQAEPEFCGDDREQALVLMRWLETATGGAESAA
jgi:Fe-S-cluster containining protein